MQGPITFESFLKRTTTVPLNDNSVSIVGLYNQQDYK